MREIREIKFQLLNTKDYYVHGYERLEENERRNRGVSESKDSYGNGVYQGAYIRRQRTGLLDKNGKEIYEGDIVERDDGSNGKRRRRCAISWVKSHYVLKGYYYDINNPEKKNPIDFKFGAFIYEKDGELEILGNIYENPDLLPL